MSIRAALGFSALALGSFFLESADSARAQDGPLDQVGGVCIPDGATIRAGLYETRGFGIGFSGSNTGTIRLLCPFTVTGDMLGVKVGITMLSFIDGDGTAEAARVQAIFREATLGTNIAITDGICNSNANTSNITGPTNMACFASEVIIKINTLYWWDVEIQRTDPQFNVEFLGVGMRYYN
jgi:hypothetical protein